MFIFLWYYYFLMITYFLFSVFAGMAVISNCLLMMSWFPACVVIWERSCQSNYDLFKSCMLVCLQRSFLSRFFQRFTISSSWLQCKCSCIGKLWSAKERLLFDFILNFRVLWLVTLSAVAVTSAVIVLYYPRLRLPSSPEFQLFDSGHPFEEYDLVYKNKFWFKRVQRVSCYYLLGRDFTSLNE